MNDSLSTLFYRVLTQGLCLDPALKYVEASQATYSISQKRILPC